MKHRNRNPRSRRYGIRPTSSRTRSAIISMLGPDGAIGMNVLELYAGTGAVGFDLLEHGAQHVDFVESDHRRAQNIKAETQKRGYENKATTYRADATNIIPKLKGNKYDLVFADPPYELDPWVKIIDALQNHDILKPNARIIAEHSTRKSLPDNIARANAINRRKYGDTTITIYRISNQA